MKMEIKMTVHKPRNHEEDRFSFTASSDNCHVTQPLAGYDVLFVSKEPSPRRRHGFKASYQRIQEARVSLHVGRKSHTWALFKV